MQEFIAKYRDERLTGLRPGPYCNIHCPRLPTICLLPL